jgi:Cu/Ag efflux protein CusF
MNSKFIPAAIAAILVASPMAVLARTQGDFTNAIVQSVNAQAMSVTLQDGTTLDVVSQALLKELTPGARVDLHVRDLNGGDVVTNVRAVS